MIQHLSQLLYWLKNQPTKCTLVSFLRAYRYPLYSGSKARQPSKFYMKFYRLIRKLPSYIKIERLDGLVWISLTPQGFDLIVSEVKFKPSKNDIYAMPKKSTQLRLDSILDAIARNTYDPQSNKFSKDNFEAYLEDIDHKYIALQMIEPTKNPKPGLLLKYKTRFNDQAILKKTLDNFDSAVAKATARYKKGVFLTLTTDPKLFESIWHANRHFAKALNRFFSCLKKWLGFRPKYIVSYEYTQNTGLMHAHIILFGISWLRKHDLITKEWQSCGQGQINYEYGLTNRNGIWRWTKKRPPADRFNNATDYLKKYLKKVLFSGDLFCHFFTFNKRFLSMSRYFTHRTICGATRTIFYRYIGSYTFFSCPEIILYNSNLIGWIQDPGG